MLTAHLGPAVGAGAAIGSCPALQSATAVCQGVRKSAAAVGRGSFKYVPPHHRSRDFFFPDRIVFFSLGFCGNGLCCVFRSAESAPEPPSNYRSAAIQGGLKSVPSHFDD